MSRFIKPLVEIFSRGRLSILIYHRVLKQKDELFPGIVDAETFRWQMELVSNYFNVLPLSDAVELMNTNSLPDGALCITFDDGYADNAEVALPILKKLGLSATFFVTTGFLDGGRMWNDTVIEAIRILKSPKLDMSDVGLEIYDVSSVVKKREAIESIITKIKHLPQEKRQDFVDLIEKKANDKLPDNLMMTSEQVRLVHQSGMEIGGHTVTHPILATLDKAQAMEEIKQGKTQLERIIGENLRCFAYPNGKPGVDYQEEHVELVSSAGFNVAVSTASGVSNRSTDRYQLRRFTPWDKTPLKYLLRLVKNYT